MKKVLGIMLLGLFLIAGNASAHCGKCGLGDAPDKDMKAMAGERNDKMAKELGLNDEQKGKLSALMNEKMEKRHAIMEENRKAMDALHEDFQAKLKGFLTEDQVKKLEEKMAGGEGHSPMWKEGKMCPKCAMMKGKDKKCPECKDGKACAKCEKMKKGDCPECKDGKMCKMCKIKKAKEGKEKHDGHDHGKDSK